MKTRTQARREKKANKLLRIYRLGNILAKGYMYLFLLVLLFGVISQAFLQGSGYDFQVTLETKLDYTNIILLFITFLLSGLVSIITESNIKETQESVR